VRFGDFSTELCGGCHINRTGRIGLCAITTEGGVSAGVRRIEAITGAAAIQRMQTQARTLEQSADRLRVSPDNLLARLDQETDKVRELERELGRLKQKLASQAGSELADSAREVNGVRVLAARIEEGGDSLRDTVDQLKNKLGTAAIVLAAADGDKVRLVAGVTPDLTDRLRAGDLVNHVAAQVGGRGGGRADFAQAGGSDPAALPAALESVTAWVQSHMENEKG